jgi:hypothetical protein
MWRYLSVSLYLSLVIYCLCVIGVSHAEYVSMNKNREPFGFKCSTCQHSLGAKPKKKPSSSSAVAIVIFSYLSLMRVNF